MKRKLNGFAVIVAAAALISLPACATLTSPIRAADNAIVSAKASSRSYGAGMWALQPILMPLNFVFSWTGEIGIGLYRDIPGWFTPGKNWGDVWLEGFYRNILELEEHQTVTDGQASGHANRGKIHYWQVYQQQEDSESPEEDEEEGDD
jgi:hypothetical protein